jgi:hypothetical protein
MKKSFLTSPGFYLTIMLVLYVTAGTLLVGYYRYQINPDGISYISIAQKYLNGDYHNAINGWWGPMYSWLLVPFLCIIPDGLLAAKILGLAVGIFIILALWRLSYRFEMAESIRITILFAAIPVVLSFAFSDITPDLILTAILLFYFAAIFSDTYPKNLSSAILCGIMGGLAYLTKSFAFPFFIFHFFVMNIIHYFRNAEKNTKRKILLNLLVGYATFSVISGVWVGLISHKYNRLTFGTAGQAAQRAEAAPGARGSAVLWMGFSPPANDTATSVWEDPSNLEMPPYNPFESWANFKHQLNYTANNIRKVADIFFNFSYFSVIVLIAYVVFWLQRPWKAKTPPELIYPVITIAMIAGAYSLVFIQARYLWAASLLLALMAGFAIERTFRSGFFPKIIKSVVLAVFFLTLAIPAVINLKHSAGAGKAVRDFAKAIKPAIPANSKIASNSNWAATLFVSYHLGCKYYGAAAENETSEEIKKQLLEFGINYYFVWGGPASAPGFLSGFKDVTAGKLPNLKIYNLNKQQ